MAHISSIILRIVTSCLAISSLISLVVAFICPPLAVTKSVWNQRWATLSSPAWLDPSGGPDQHYLIDCEGTHTRPLTFPEGPRWGLISVSPWSNESGAVEAVGQCYRGSIGGSEPFWGLARISLSEGSIIEEIPLDVLPMGRPCWSPTNPGRIFFGAGDGRLYGYDFATLSGLDEVSGGEQIAEASTVHPLTWECNSPSLVTPYIVDPSCSTQAGPELFMVASVVPRGNEKGQGSIERTQIWWFRVDPDRNAIRAAGILLDPNSGVRSEGSVVARYPLLASTADGSGHLTYLARRSGDRVVQLEAIAIQLDPATSCPRVVPGEHPRVLESNVILTPPVVALDGRSVICLTRNNAQPTRYTLSGHSGVRFESEIEVADRLR